MRKKCSVVMLSVILAWALALNGCGAQQKEPAPLQEQEEIQEETVPETEDEEAEEESESSLIPTGTEEEPPLYSWPDADEMETETVYTDDDLMNITLYGTVFTFRGEHPNGTDIDAVGLKLEEPILIDTEYTGRIRVEEVHLAQGKELTDEDLKGFEGLDVCVGGKGFGAHTAWHLRDLVVPVDWIYELEDYEDEGRYSSIDDVELGYYLDVDNLEEALVLLSGRWYADRSYDTNGNVQTAREFADALIYYEFDTDKNVTYASGKASEADADGTLDDTHKTALKAEFILGQPEDMENVHVTSWYVKLTGATYAEGDFVYATQRGKYLYVFAHGEDDVFVEQLYAKNTAESGKPMQMSAEEQKQANLFLSNFAEQSDGSFSFDGSFHMATLVDFAFNFARANNPEKITVEDDMEAMPLSTVNTYLKRYTSYIIPVAETFYVEGDNFYYEEGNIYHTITEGTEYPLLAIARQMERGRGNIRFIDYDVYELDPVEYRAQGIDKSYYEMTAAEAEKTPSLKKVSRGRAVAEAFYTGTRDSFRLISNESIFTVGTVRELREAIGDHRVIEMESGTYDVTDEEALLSNCNGLTIRAATPDEGVVELVCTDPYSNVLEIESCSGLTLENLVLGHILEEGDCGGNVLGFYECNNITLRSMDLYGCGAYGVFAMNSTGIAVYDSVIHDCSYGCVSAIESYGLNFYDSVFRDCRQYTMIDLMDGSAFFERCKFYRLEGAFINESENYFFDAGFIECLFDEEVLKQLQEHPQLGGSVYVTNQYPVG